MILQKTLVATVSHCVCALSVKATLETTGIEIKKANSASDVSASHTATSNFCGACLVDTSDFIRVHVLWGWTSIPNMVEVVVKTHSLPWKQRCPNRTVSVLIHFHNILERPPIFTRNSFFHSSYSNFGMRSFEKK